MTLYPHQQKFLDDPNNSHAILAYEVGCLHPDTIIEDAITGESNTIRQWSELGRGFSVKAYDKYSKKFVFAKANPPVAYTPSSFYKFYFQSGDVICVTPQHRFLVSTSRGGIWKSAKELVDSSFQMLPPVFLQQRFLLPFLVPFYQLPSIVGHSSFWLPSGVQRLMNKVLNFLYRYSNRSHLCDRRPLEVARNDQGIFPLQDDAHGLYSVYYGKDEWGYISDDKKCIPSSSQSLCRLSKKSSSHHYYNNLAFSPEHQVSLSDSGQAGSLSQIFQRFDNTLILLRTKISTFLYRVLFSFSNRIRINRIWKVERVETQAVYYDFHVPYYENYLLGGVVNHNCGKTFTAARWVMQHNRHRNVVIVCPKQIKKAWRQHAPFGTHYSFEEFTKAYKTNTLPPNPSAVVVDEVDNMASPLFVAKQRSQRAEAMYTYLQTHPEAHVLLLTATPVRSTPWNMHTLLIYVQKLRPQDWKEYRERYFSLQHKPYLPRPAWLPVPTWRKDMQELINKHCQVALMRDLVDIMPPETHEVITLKSPDYTKNTEWEPAKQFVEDHRLEQPQKLAEIKRIAKGYRKVAVVVHYRQQIDDLYKQLSKERACFVLDGRTKDPESVIASAEADAECYFIIQASVGAGFEIPSFSCMIFASQGYSVRNYVQTRGRIKRINALQPVIYYYLQGGRCDRLIYKNLMAGRDFVPSEYLADI